MALAGGRHCTAGRQARHGWEGRHHHRAWARRAWGGVGPLPGHRHQEARQRLGCGRKRDERSGELRSSSDKWRPWRCRRPCWDGQRQTCEKASCGAGPMWPLPAHMRSCQLRRWVLHVVEGEVARCNRRRAGPDLLTSPVSHSLKSIPLHALLLCSIATGPTCCCLARRGCRLPRWLHQGLTTQRQ